jgi:hypothetical protein
MLVTKSEQAQEIHKLEQDADSRPPEAKDVKFGRLDKAKHAFGIRNKRLIPTFFHKFDDP